MPRPLTARYHRSQMNRTIAALVAASLAAAAVSTGCLFGGSETPISAQRPSSVPTATPPASLPAPIAVGETQAGSAPSASSISGGATYVVKSGDTLGGIAAQFGVPPAQQAAWVQEVLRLNGIPDAAQLQSGVELRLPNVQPTPRPSGTPAATSTISGAGAAATSTPAVAATPRPTVTGGGGTYTVVSGDYPLLIAQKLGVPEAQQTAWVNQLVVLNNINPSNLQVGVLLQLPALPPGSSTATATPSN